MFLPESLGIDAAVNKHTVDKMKNSKAGTQVLGTMKIFPSLKIPVPKEDEFDSGYVGILRF